MSADPAANALSLSLNDLLASPSHVRVMPDDATDRVRVRLRGEDWFNGGAIDALDDYPYVGWNNSTARMLTDQDMVNNGRVL